ncbi:unnamed protein product [Vitrella brassicaformis CCMP3155]|uniref:Saccharopine dehydrogenase NADP binding domain-containing protein n=2 Tax=Vitrella brassicaformis TaxID=1169539 RepID=A0A0G4EWP6_VITBC|nr:unnamed protein product [Vitrella brassicaformis CCMP3155]|eukprot:CEM02489.1 unnamed protein product [Vitrella brassicaformis CCMP3155]
MVPSPHDDERASRQHDLIVWGATGFTGKLLSNYLAENYGPSGHSVKYALGGRSEAKLTKLREDLAQETADKRFLDTPLVIGNAGSEESMQRLAKQTRVVASLVGPFEKSGENLVKACAEAGTHYVDITAEYPFMRRMIVKYSSLAEENGAKIVHACGFDSVPSDMGTFMVQAYAKEHFGHPCQRIRYGLTRLIGLVSGGTVHSLIELFSFPLAVRQVRNEDTYLVDPMTIEESVTQETMKLSGWMLCREECAWDPNFGAYAAPFIMAPTNTKIVKRTAALLPTVYGSEFDYGECLAVRNMIVARLFAWFTLLCEAVLIAFPAARWIVKALLRPGWGPPAFIRRLCCFAGDIVGTVRDGVGKYHKITGRVGINEDPGYDGTAKMLCESALCAALDAPTIPSTCGVLTPAVAFGPTLIKRLKKTGMTFEVAATEMDAAESTDMGSDTKRSDDSLTARRAVHHRAQRK